MRKAWQKYTAQRKKNLVLIGVGLYLFSFFLLVGGYQQLRPDASIPWVWFAVLSIANTIGIEGFILWLEHNMMP